MRLFDDGGPCDRELTYGELENMYECVKDERDNALEKIEEIKDHYAELKKMIKKLNIEIDFMV